MLAIQFIYPSPLRTTIRRQLSVQGHLSCVSIITMVSMDWDYKPPTNRKPWLARLTSRFWKSHKKEQTNSKETKYWESLVNPPDKIAIVPVVDKFIEIGEVCSQEQSLLFRLPTEIRQTIYRHVFGPSVIHIESLCDRLAHVTCQQWQSEDGWDGHAH